MYWDIHCHTDRLTEDEMEEAVKRKIVVGAVAMDVEGAHKILEQKERYPENIRVFLGIHPEVEVSQEETEKMLNLIEERRDLLAGIGEVGIPYFYMEGKSPEERNAIKQRGAELLERFVETAARYDLPLNLHVVGDDVEIALPILEGYGIRGALFHWYEGRAEQLKRLVDGGHYISVSPEIVTNQHYFDFVKGIPLARLLLESDAPCPYGEERGVPTMIFQVAERLAEYHEIEKEELLRIAGENTLNYLRTEE
jgi:TatD DNase family protein